MYAFYMSRRRRGRARGGYVGVAGNFGRSINTKKKKRIRVARVLARPTAVAVNVRFCGCVALGG